jgi:hypothetical protein
MPTTKDLLASKLLRSQLQRGVCLSQHSDSHCNTSLSHGSVSCPGCVVRPVHHRAVVEQAAAVMLLGAHCAQQAP